MWTTSNSNRNKFLNYHKYYYFITFLDIKSRFLELKLIKNKDEAKKAFETYINKYENKTNKRIKLLNTDNGREYINS